MQLAGSMFLWPVAPHPTIDARGEGWASLLWCTNTLAHFVLEYVHARAYDCVDAPSHVGIYIAREHDRESVGALEAMIESL